MLQNFECDMHQLRFERIKRCWKKLPTYVVARGCPLAKCSGNDIIKSSFIIL